MSTDTLFPVVDSLAPAAAGLSRKQSVIVEFMRKSGGKITLSQAVALTGKNLYANAQFHTGATLARMVKRGLVRRIKPGVFGFPEVRT